MDTTYINTIDGKTKVEWWDADKFTGRVTQIISADETVTIPIPNTAILCDFCNEKITEFPVPVLYGTHALCSVCYEDVKKEEESNDKQ